MTTSQISNQGGRAEKTMSSRLLTMKFMQRAAASSPPQPSTPASQPTPTLSEPSSKRQKLTHSPSATALPRSDQQAIQAALDAEEAKRSEAIERVAAERGETKWVLSYVDQAWNARREGLKVAKAGYGDIDAGGGDGAVAGSWMMGGRRSFGKFNKALEKRQNGGTDNTSSPSSDEASTAEEDIEDGATRDDASGTDDLIRESKEAAGARAKAERRAKKKAEKSEAAQMAEQRRSKDINLNRLSSISGTVGAGAKDRGGKANVECHGCGEKGHIRRDCPDTGKKRPVDLNRMASEKRSIKLDVLEY